MKSHLRCAAFLLSAPWMIAAQGAPAVGVPLELGTSHFVSRVEQLRQLAAEDFLKGCNFTFTGTVTLVDTNRDLVVLQDATGAVGLHADWRGHELSAGQSVTIQGQDCAPYFSRWPEFPYRPAGKEVSATFEIPFHTAEYRLTRVRAFLRPPMDGIYQFWIASDNSSELWLSSSSSRAEMKRLASLARFEWVNPNEWTRFPSQRSDPVSLKAGELHYIEALVEQNIGGEHLSVAWSGPAFERTVIAREFLVPWTDRPEAADASATGVLREYWTNYSRGDLVGLGGPRRFDSMLTVRDVAVQIHGPGKEPTPEPISLDQPLRDDQNLRWVEVVGVVRFATADAGMAWLELSDGKAVTQVRALGMSRETAAGFVNTAVRVEGVCEGVSDTETTLWPRLIWTSGRDAIEVVHRLPIEPERGVSAPATPVSPTNSAAMEGFFGTRGVVTFNGTLSGEDYIFVQEDTTIVRVSLQNPAFKSQLKVGQRVELGGALDATKELPVIVPLVVSDIGWHPMPAPILQPLKPSPNRIANGRWAEIEGVVHKRGTNGTLIVATRDGVCHLWMNEARRELLDDLVDAKIRVRGVCLQNRRDEPLLLVPSEAFLSADEVPRRNPFGLARNQIGELLATALADLPIHRVLIVGQVTYADAEFFFVQDGSGGIRVSRAPEQLLQIGESVEVVAFAATAGETLLLTDAMVRPAKTKEALAPVVLSLAHPASTDQEGILVRLSATLLAVRTNRNHLVFELQEQQRVFGAILQSNAVGIPMPPAGSKIQVTGVCDDGVAAAALDLARTFSHGVLLRNAADLVVLSGPPWWTWKRAAALFGMLVVVLLVTLLWVQLLRRRLDRQEAEQFAFSKRVLERLEDERRRIAANLHDSLGQTLLVIKNHAIMAGHLPPQTELRNRLDQISGATSSALEEIRQITHGLRPYQLDRMGLTHAIRALVTRASETTSILFASRLEPIDGLFDKEAEINIYRILQEAVTNVVKHSKATEAAVVIRKRPGRVSISIRDNGCGFDPSNPPPRPCDIGYGLSGISERVRILRGTLDVDSHPGEGTSLTVEVPSPETNEGL